MEAFEQYARSHQTEICLETERVHLLIQKLGSPELSFKVIHVAGTNGKGSVCAFVQNALTLSGKKTGKFSSPQLFSVNDTITVDSKSISNQDLNRILRSIQPFAEEVNAETNKPLSQFEITVAAALLYFRQQGCEAVILECGMGGQGDATNAIADSAISVITSISLDHTHFLGDSVEKIAANKCGIFKKSSQIVTGRQKDTVYDVIQKNAAPKRITTAKVPHVHGFDGVHAVFDYDGITGIRSALGGIYQAENAAIAIEVLRLLGVEDPFIKKGIETAVHPARFEKLTENLYFDGAHNPMGMAALVDTLNQGFAEAKKILIMGFMADKDILGALKMLQNIRGNFEIYAVPVKTNPRSETAENLKKAAQSLGYTVTVFENVKEAIQEANTKCNLTCVCGSLYLYKEL